MLRWPRAENKVQKWTDRGKKGNGNREGCCNIRIRIRTVLKINWSANKRFNQFYFGKHWVQNKSQQRLETVADSVLPEPRISDQGREEHGILPPAHCAHPCVYLIYAKLWQTPTITSQDVRRRQLKNEWIQWNLGKKAGEQELCNERAGRRVQKLQQTDGRCASGFVWGHHAS